MDSNTPYVCVERIKRGRKKQHFSGSKVGQILSIAKKFYIIPFRFNSVFTVNYPKHKIIVGHKSIINI